jgi:hypothetical protein
MYSKQNFYETESYPVFVLKRMTNALQAVIDIL